MTGGVLDGFLIGSDGETVGSGVGIIGVGGVAFFFAGRMTWPSSLTRDPSGYKKYFILGKRSMGNISIEKKTSRNSIF